MKQPQRFESHVAIPDESKTHLIQTLNACLATALDLQLQVKQAHWNIKGPQFFARHELFDAVAERLRETVDSMAERASTLGGYAKGTVRLAAAGSKLPEYDLNAVDGRMHIKTLVDRFATYSQLLRGAIRESGDADPASEDLFTEALRKAELDMWFLESHLNATA